MCLAECQNNPIDVNFHLQNSLKIFDKNSADKFWSKKKRGWKVSSLVPIRVKFHFFQRCSLELDAQTEIFESYHLWYWNSIFLFSSMLYSDFAAAAVLISFGVIIGTTSPLQLMVMALIEIVLFFINEVIGRKYLKVRQFF